MLGSESCFLETGALRDLDFSLKPGFNHELKWSARAPDVCSLDGGVGARECGGRVKPSLQLLALFLRRRFRVEPFGGIVAHAFVDI